MISLIAAILDQVDITQYWNTGIKREKDYLASCELSHVVHSDLNYRAPFLQWLFPLFVNLNAFGADTYPDLTLRVNPLQNTINYQKDMNLELKTRGRELFLQPDAGDDGSGKNYKQFSCYLNDESKASLFMPWSVALSLLVDDGIAEPALRNHLKNNLHSPFGLSDSAYQMTGSATPEKITARHDLWNTGLSTIAMFSYLFSDNLFLTNLPKVQCVLKEVFNSCSSCNSYKIFTKNESCEFIIKCGDHVKVFGAGDNTITVQSGGKVECINFVGANVINIVGDSASDFTVRRSGATVYLENTSTGTFIKIPATKTAQTIIFNNITLTLVIKTNQVMLGNQVINLTQSPIL